MRSRIASSVMTYIVELPPNQRQEHMHPLSTRRRIVPTPSAIVTMLITASPDRLSIAWERNAAVLLAAIAPVHLRLFETASYNPIGAPSTVLLPVRAMMPVMLIP